MALDAKVGSLIGLLLIFIVAFVINGFTRSGRTKGENVPTVAMTDNTRDSAIGERGLTYWPAVGQGENDSPTDGATDTTSVVTPVETTPTVLETTADDNVKVAPPEPAAPSVSEVYYTVCEGDNLADVAKKFYGPKEGNRRVNVLRIFEANRKVLKFPNEIFVGQRLLIPPLKAQKSDASIFSSSMFETVTSIGREHLSAHSSDATPGLLYAVQKGDSLWGIAATLLGDGSRYKEISALNTDVLKDEDSLKVGTRLLIPAR